MSDPQHCVRDTTPQPGAGKGRTGHAPSVPPDTGGTPDASVPADAGGTPDASVPADPGGTPDASVPADAGGTPDASVPADPGGTPDASIPADAEGTEGRHHQWAALAGFAAITMATAVGGALVGPSRPSTMTWYRSLRKPPFQPPASVFGPVWTGLYATIAYSGWRVWRAPSSRERTRALALWGVQMAANAAWTPLFFGARKTRLALADLVAQLAATAGYTATAARVDGPAATTMAPYLAWTSFAGALNTEIVRRNG